MLSLSSYLPGRSSRLLCWLLLSLQHLNRRGSQVQVLRLFLGNLHKHYLFKCIQSHHPLPTQCPPPGQASARNPRPINLTAPLTSLLGCLKGSQTLQSETKLLTCLLPNLDPKESLISENGSSIPVVAEAKTLEVILDLARPPSCLVTSPFNMHPEPAHSSPPPLLHPRPGHLDLDTFPIRSVCHMAA